MLFLWRNLAAIYVALFASVLAWLFGGMRGDWLAPVMPWLLFGLLEVIIFFPQRDNNEDLTMARRRVWRAMGTDPVVALCFALIVLLAFPLANVGLCPKCDAQAIAKGASMLPPLKGLPFCVNALDHLNVFYWFAGAMLSVIAVRHALTPHGRRVLIHLLVWNGMALAIFGFLEGATGAKGPYWIAQVSKWKSTTYFFSTFGYPNAAGAYFTLLFGLAIASWRRRSHDVRLDLAKDREHELSQQMGLFWRQNLYLIPAGVLFFAALNTLSRAAILLASASAAIYAVYTFVAFLSRHSRKTCVWAMAWALLALVIVALGTYLFLPERLQKEVDTIDARGVLNRVSGKDETYAKVATAIWRDNKVFGVGGWGYAHLASPQAKKMNLDVRGATGGTNVHNDYLQFLTEHGIVGCVILAGILALLLWPVFREWGSLVNSARFTKEGEKRTAKPVQIYALPAPAFCILVACSTTLIHACGDCPFRSAAVLVLFFISVAAVDGFIPSLNNPNAVKNKEKTGRKRHGSRKRELFEDNPNVPLR